MSIETKNTVGKEQKYNPLVVTRRWFYAEFVPRRFYKLCINKDTQEKIEFARNLLARNPEISYVVGQNHQTIDDPVFGGFIAKQIDPKVSRHVFAPVSYSHTTNTEDPTEKDTVKMANLVRSCGIEAIPVIQAYQVHDPNCPYSKEEIIKNYTDFVVRLREFSKSDKSYGCIITPEGHRSEDGTLGKGEPGIMNIIKAIKPALVIPLGVYSEEALERDHKNFGKRINLNIGEMSFVDKNDKKGNIDEFMTQLAQALPPQMRGEYENNIL